MTKKSFLLIALISGIFQVTILHYLRIFSVKPDLLLICVVLAGLFFEFKWAVFFSIFAGLFKDIFVVSTFGINTLFFPLWSFLIIRVSKKISLDSDYIRALLIFLIVIINDIVTRLLLLYFGNFISFGVFLRITFLEGLYTAAVSLLIFKAVKKYADKGY